MIGNKFLYFSTVASYEAALSEIQNTSIVFVGQAANASEGLEEVHFIETHGVRFDTDAVAEISQAIAALDVTNLTNTNAAARGVTLTINEVDGKITSIDITDLGQAKLGTYSIGSDSTAIAQGDTIATALAKLENQIKAKVGSLNSDIATGSDKYFTGIELKDGKLVDPTAANSKTTVANVDTAKLLDYKANTGSTAQTISTNDTIAGAIAKVQKNVEIETTARQNAIDAMDYTIPSSKHIEGRAVTSVSEANGVIDVNEGNVKSDYVSYTPQNLDGPSVTTPDTTNTNVQDVLAEIFQKIYDNGKAGEVKVYKNNTVVSTISADGTDYVIKQGTNTVATLNIAKDMVISSGEVITASGTEKKGTSASSDSAGLTSGEKYIKLTISNADTTANLLYIPVNSLYKDHTVEKNAAKIQLAISSSNVISATVVSGSLVKTDLTSSLQNEITSARTKITEKSTGHVRITKTAGTGATPDSYTVSEDDIASASLVGTLPTGTAALGETTVVGYAEAYADKKAADAKTVVKAKNTGHVQVGVTTDATDGHQVVTVSENDIASAAYVGTFTAVDGETTVVGHSEKVAEAAENAAKTYADNITVNGQSQTNQNITVEADDINIATGYAKASTGADIAAGDSVQTAFGKVEKKIDNLNVGSPFAYTNGTSKTGGVSLKSEGLNTTHEGEVAIGKYNNSVTGAVASANTVFSIGNGSGTADRSNAIEVRENGDIWINIGSDYKKLQTILSNEIDWYEGS